MKIALTNTVTFTPASKTIKLGITDFDVRRLYAIINQTNQTILYATATPGRGYTAISGDTITLAYDTTAMSATDVLQVLYDDSEDLELTRMLYEVAERLAFLPSVRGTLADLRVSVVNAPAVTNQTQIGGYNANPQIPALTNVVAVQSNINNIAIT